MVYWLQQVLLLDREKKQSKGTLVLRWQQGKTNSSLASQICFGLDSAFMVVVGATGPIAMDPCGTCSEGVITISLSFGLIRQVVVLLHFF